MLWLIKHLATQLWRNITFDVEASKSRVEGYGRTGLTAQAVGDTNSAMKNDAITKSQRSNLESSYNFLSKDFGHGAERNIRRMELKYVLIDSELYLWTAEYLFLKCLDSDQARVVIRKDHEGIGVYGNQFPRWSDCLEESIFCPTTMSDCFK